MIPCRVIPRSAFATVLAAVLATLPFPAAAQETETRYILVDPRLEGSAEPWDIQAAHARSRFQLFGEGDRAWTSLRMVGDNRIFETNTGPGDDRNLWSLGHVVRQFSTARGTVDQTFGIPLMMGAPRSEWVKLLTEGVDALQNAGGGGFTVMWNAAIFARTKDHNAADGLVGTLLSGAQSATDGTCLDHFADLGGARMPAGFQLLPASNCTPTWSPAGGWLGDRPILPDTWAELFQEQGSGFRFDRWRVPAERKVADAFMGTNVSTYGHFNDYNSNTRLKFGNAVPGGSGAPTRPGWPLGIDFEFDAFTFTLPSVANAKFWGGRIINNSDALYGVLHDYDSLYVGIGPWPNQIGQDGDAYVIPELGAWVVSNSHTFGGPECQQADPVPLIGNTCGGFGQGIGFDAGAMGIIVLKSPIGDLRNKLFTQAGSPFFDPSHLLAGDTITFNHAVNWNFGTWGQVWNQGTERMKFGVMSSTPDNTVDGRACGDFSRGLGDRWSTFQSPLWPDEQCVYRRFVPGVDAGASTWTYVTGRPNSKPLAPDTLHLVNCGPTGCPEAWADTIWNGWSANRAANLAQFSIGPFRLEAGETTELMIAMYSARDSVSFEATTRAIVDFYLGLFAGPEAPPTVTIRQVDIGAGLRPGQNAEVRLVWDDAPEQWVDPFLVKFADDMDDADTGTDLATIRDANPGLTDRIRARASDNVSRLLIFRSCDGGLSFDADGDCVGDRAVDAFGNTIEPGWQAFAVLEPDASGDLPNTFTDGQVTPGVRYLYTILGESRGFRETVIDDPDARREIVNVETDPVTGDTISADTLFTCGLGPCETRELAVAPPLLNPLSRSAADPNVLSVYVPASGAAGGRIAEVEFSDVDTLGKASVPFEVRLASADARENVFETWFGNRLTIVEYRDADTDNLFGTKPRSDTVGTGDGVTARFSGTLSFPRIQPASVTISDGVQTVQDDGAGGFTGDTAVSGTNTIDYVTGQFDVTFRLAAPADSAVTATYNQELGVQVTVEDVARVVVGDTGTTTSTAVLSSRMFWRPDGVPVTLNAATVTSDVTADDVRTVRFVVGPGNLNPNQRFGVGFALVERVGGDSLPLLVSGRLDGSGTTPGGFLGHPQFPGFMVLADNRSATGFDEQFYVDARGDTLSIQRDPTLSFSSGASINTGLQGLTFGEHVITFEDSVFGARAPFRIDFFNPANTDAEFDASVRARRVGTTGVTDAEAEALVAAALGQTSVVLEPARIPFTVRNATHGRPPAELAMVARGEVRKILGLPPDTISVTVDPDIWMPFDPLVVIETVDLYQTRVVSGVQAIVVDTLGNPIRAPRRVVTFSALRLTCGGANPSCNPVRGTGFGQWIGVRPDDNLHFKYFSPFTSESKFAFTPRRSVQGMDIITQGRSIREQMDQIRVVPNPYIFFSSYEAASDQRRLLFTNLPPDGVLRIYTVSGQFVQELDWQPSDLTGNGDLFWNLRTREGNDLGAGLYVFVIRARDPATGQDVKKMGKFVVIR